MTTLVTAGQVIRDAERLARQNLESVYKAIGRPVDSDDFERDLSTLTKMVRGYVTSSPETMTQDEINEVTKL